MRGYEPQRQIRPGGCREIFSLSWIAMSIVFPVLLAVFAAIALVAGVFALASVHPLLALIPIGLLAASFVALALLDRRRQAALEEELGGESGPSGPPRR